MPQITAYLNFSGDCREAMTFYKECLGGELNLQTVEGSPIEAQCPTAMKNQILHSTLVQDRLLLSGSDMVGPDGYIKGNNIGLLVVCNSEEEINHLYTALGSGGKIIDPLKLQFWGSLFGVVTDKFGVRWMFNYNKNAAVQQ